MRPTSAAKQQSTTAQTETAKTWSWASASAAVPLRLIHIEEQYVQRPCGADPEARFARGKQVITDESVLVTSALSHLPTPFSIVGLETGLVAAIGIAASHFGKTEVSVGGKIGSFRESTRAK